MQIISILVGTQPKDMANRNREYLIHFKHPSLKVYFFMPFECIFIDVFRCGTTKKRIIKKTKVHGGKKLVSS